MGHNQHSPTDDSPGITVNPSKDGQSFLVEWWARRVAGPPVHTARGCATQEEVDALTRKVLRDHARFDLFDDLVIPSR